MIMYFKFDSIDVFLYHKMYIIRGNTSTLDIVSWRAAISISTWATSQFYKKI